MKWFDKVDITDTRNMLAFYEVEDKDINYQNWECEIDGGILRILKHKANPFYSVYARRYVKENGVTQWYMEISSQKATSLTDAKNVAEKMYDIVLWYKVPWWKE